MILAPKTDPVTPAGGGKPLTAAPFVAPPGGLPPFDVYDANEHTRKSSRYESEHYRELAGKHVAWAFDGAFVLAAETATELFAALDNVGIGRENYISDYIDPEPEVAVPGNRLGDRAMVENDVFIPNSARYLAEHYLELAGKHLAWSFDGKTVLATAPTLAELYAAMTDAGREDYVTDYIDPLPVVVPQAVPMSRAS